MSYSPGDFSFFTCQETIAMYSHDYQIVTSNNLWDYLKKRNTHEAIQLGYDLFSLDWYSDSGSAINASICEMEWIAKNGWNAYVTFMKNKAIL